MGFLKREIQVQHGRILHRSHATSGYVGLSQLKKQKLEAAGSSGAVQALRMENDAPVVGPDAPTANSKTVKRDIARGRGRAALPYEAPGQCSAVAAPCQAAESVLIVT